MAVVSRLLRGEPLDLVARDTNVSVAKLTEGRERALEGAASRAGNKRALHRSIPNSAAMKASATACWSTASSSGLSDNNAAMRSIKWRNHLRSSSVSGLRHVQAPDSAELGGNSVESEINLQR